MNEGLYGVSSALIALVLLATMIAAIEAAYRVGLRRFPRTGDHFRGHVFGIQASVLGVLALLLGFTFSLALQRYDARSDAVVAEANAIGTAYLRAGLLPAEPAAAARASLREYTDARVVASVHAEDDERRAALARVPALQDRLWEHARRAAAADPGPVASGLFVQAVNDVIDAFGRRGAMLERHVPEVVLLLLYATFLLAAAIVGYGAGIAGHRPSLTSHMMVLLIVILVFIVLDLDRPRRGLVQVSQQSLVDLQSAMRRDATRRADDTTSPERAPIATR